MLSVIEMSPNEFGVINSKVKEMTAVLVKFWFPKDFTCSFTEQLDFPVDKKTQMK